MASVLDVAEAILQRKSPLDTFRLHKLVYFAQAVHLARTGAPLFQDPLEAWRQGPVSRRLFREHRRSYKVSSVGGNAGRLDAAQLGSVDEMLRIYGRQSDRWLVRQTHLDEPWRAARGDLPPDSPSQQRISTRDVRGYYARILQDDAVAATSAWRDKSQAFSGDEIRSMFDT